MPAPATTTVTGDPAKEIKMSPSQIDGAGEEVNVRNFCFSCHTTADLVGGKPQGWSGSAMVGIDAGATVEGLDRTTGTRLRLPTRSGHLSTNTTQSCYQCHGNDYTTVTSNNVHNPSGGVSTGGQDCYGCHNGMQPYMEDDTAPKTGSSNATVYHHVLGGDPDGGGAAGYTDGDKAFALGQYPTDVNAVFCLSCHVDHGSNGFTPTTKSSNLRGTFTSTPSKTNTDWDDTTNTGICTSCHATSLAKSAATEKLSDGRTNTPMVANAAYDASAHKYTASSTFTGTPATTFNASCSKCHSDEQTKDYQNSTYKFGTHYSANQHILSALGGTNADQLQETHCYRCHSRVAPADATLGGTRKSVAARDYYNAAGMTAASERVYAQFQLAGSSHPVVADAAGSVECESCHNAHVVTTTTGRVTDPDNTYNTVGYGNDANQVTFCLKCHDGTLPTASVNGATYIPYTVTQANAATTDNKSTYNGTGKAHWDLTGSTAANATPAYAAVTGPVSCAECHENHGSAAPKLLGSYDMTDSRNEINSSQVIANDNTVCEKCHYAADTTWPT
ncbi:hypothetical protein EG835_04365, partial [bacterium]|nr:hypothetical protein [bacterium]